MDIFAGNSLQVSGGSPFEDGGLQVSGDSLFAGNSLQVSDGSLFAGNSPRVSGCTPFQKRSVLLGAWHVLLPEGLCSCKRPRILTTVGASEGRMGVGSGCFLLHRAFAGG